MKALLKYFIAAIFLFGVIGCSQPRFSESRAKYMEQNTNKIKVNMTKQDLRDTLGKPDYYDPKASFSYDEKGLEKANSWLYFYPDDHFSHQIDFDPHTGKVISSKKVSTPTGFL